MTDRLPVMVTAVGGGGFGEQILKALRLSGLDLEIVGTDMSPVSTGLCKVERGYVVPPASDARYPDILLSLCRRHGVLAVFPGSEAELKVLSACRSLFADAGIVLPINPADVIDIGLDKTRTFSFLDANGFACPKTFVVRAEADLARVDVAPCVLKPSIGGGGSVNVMIAQRPAEVQMLGRYLLSLYDEFIVQEYVGTPEEEYTVGVLTSMDGEFINSIALKRNILSSLSNRVRVPNRSGNGALGRTLAISSGISQGFIDRFPEVTAACEAIAARLGSRSAINLQCRVVGGRVYVFEINPRFSGTTSLRAMVGFNEPGVLLRKHVLHERVEPRFTFRSGYIGRGLEECLVDGSRQFEAVN